MKTDQESCWDILKCQLTSPITQNSPTSPVKNADVTPKTPNRPDKMVSNETLHSIIDFHCCKQYCLGKFGISQVNQCKIKRNSFF